MKLFFAGITTAAFYGSAPIAAKTTELGTLQLSPMEQAQQLVAEAAAAAKKAEKAAGNARLAADEANEKAKQAQAALDAINGVSIVSPLPPTPKPRDCSLDTKQGREAIYDKNPSECVRWALERQRDQNSKNNIATSKPLNEPQKRQLLDRRGFTGKFEASSAASQASLEYTKVFTHRSLSQDNQQRISNSALTFGIRADIEDGKKSAQLASLDSLSSGLVAKLAFGRNYYKWEPKNEVLTRATKMYGEGSAEGVFDACLAAQKKQKATGTGDPILCAGQGLIDWMFVFNPESAKFKNKDQVEVFNKVYWGSDEKVPRWGWGFEGEVARPKFTYIPFATVEMADQLSPGETKTVLDPALFPTDLKAATVPKDAKLNWALKAYAYKHWPQGELFGDANGFYASRISGTTLIGSLAYKREYSLAKAFKDLTVCPDGAPSQAFDTNLDCTKINAAAPILEKGFVLGGEVRQLLDVTRYLPPVGIAPRYTYAFDTERNGFELPVYFAFDGDEKLSGGLKFSHAWGGQDRTGKDIENETLFSIFFGTTFSLNGSE